MPLWVLCIFKLCSIERSLERCSPPCLLHFSEYGLPFRHASALDLLFITSLRSELYIRWITISDKCYTHRSTLCVCTHYLNIQRFPLDSPNSNTLNVYNGKHTDSTTETFFLLQTSHHVILSLHKLASYYAPILLYTHCLHLVNCGGILTAILRDCFLLFGNTCLFYKWTVKHNQQLSKNWSSVSVGH